jgi:hypothetical protein
MLEPGSLEVVRFDAPFGGGPLWEQPLEHPPRDPDRAALFAYLDPEFEGLPLSVPAGVLGEGEEHRRLRPRSRTFSIRSLLSLQWKPPVAGACCL